MTERPADSVISRTCFYTAAGRAVGAREPDPSARNPDYLAEKLLGDDPRLVLDHPSTRALSLGYEEAMKEIGYAHGGVDNSPEKLFDGAVFDPKDPEAFAKGAMVKSLKGAAA